MTPLEMMRLSQGLSDLYVGLETDLIANIAEYLAHGDLHSSTAQWKIRMLAQLGALDRMNLQTIAAYAGLAPDLLEGILEAAALTAIEELEPGFQSLVREGIIHNTPTSIERTMERALKTYNKQAANSLNMVNTVMQYKAKAAARKIINDTAELENKQSFLDMLNKAAGKAITGAESRQAAMRQCIREMTEKGIPAFVDRAGREWSPEAYINMDIRTTASNTAHQAQFDRMDDYGLHLLSVSSHAGARPKCAKDQGKIFNRSGGGGYTEDLHGRKIRYYAWKDSSYGEPDGLLGINCGHQVYPFVPGLDVQRYFPYDEEENAELYEKTQQQRELERRVRRSKRECIALETVGDEEGLRKASATLKQRQQALRQYCEDNGLSYKPDRTAVVGYHRTVAGKVNAVNRGKTLDFSGGSGIIKETGYHAIGDKSAEPYKPNYSYESKVSKEFKNTFDDEYGKAVAKYGEINTVRGVHVLNDKSTDEGTYNDNSGFISLRHADRKNGSKTMAAIAQKMHREGKWSTGNPNHVIRHEIGHAIQAHHRTHDARWTKKIERISDIFGKAFANEDGFALPSTYAGIDINEFISECIAASYSKKQSKTVREVVSIIIGGEL